MGDNRYRGSKLCEHFADYAAVFMPADAELIKNWLKRIDASPLSVNAFFRRHKVPFARSKYYVYKKLVDEEYNFKTPPKRGGNQKIGDREEAFLRGCLSSGAVLTLDEIREKLKKGMRVSVDRSTISRAMARIFPDCKPHVGRPTIRRPVATVNSLGGFELFVAVAFYLKWPERVGEVIVNSARGLKRKMTREGRFKMPKDKRGRRRDGRFTADYNNREDVRASRFASVEDKRKRKNWESMNIMRDHEATIIRKSIAVLSLPVVTGNGHVRTVNLPLGQALEDLCGFNYSQPTLTKFLAELKYMSVSGALLRDLPKFWQKCWGDDVSKMQGPALCYYLDGNTRPLWSSKPVMKNKVTMLGRVMGCLESVFIHDGLGHPIYFETFSGRGPVGEYILEMFDKIESEIMEVPGSSPSVCRAIVMDAASNSVQTLRAFADQKNKYHYITTLDDNQWSERRVRNPGPPIRYRHGDATLREVEYELADSQDNGFLIVVRAIKISWDESKRQTVLVTSLPRETVDASEVVYSYFRRWPAEESVFRDEKAGVSLNRVCGYGKKKVTNERVKTKLENLERTKEKLQTELKETLAAIAVQDKAIAALIPRETKLREQTKIAKGVREIPHQIRPAFKRIQKQISFHAAKKKGIIAQDAKKYRRYTKTQREWLRLQSKKEVYQVDVELDQIVTYYRMSFAHICAYFVRHFLGGQPITLVMLLQSVAHLQAEIIESNTERKVTLRENLQDMPMMEKLRGAIAKLNALKVEDNRGKIYQFALA